MAREVGFKIVYGGPPFAGKTECLRYLEKQYPQPHSKVTWVVTPPIERAAMDFVPQGLGEVRGFKSRLLLSTLFGEVKTEGAWKYVLNVGHGRGVDGIVFVADSRRSRMDANLAARRELLRELTEVGVDPASVQFTLLCNRRDAADVVGVAELQSALEMAGAPCFEGIATEGQGVFDALKATLKPLLVAFKASV